MEEKLRKKIVKFLTKCSVQISSYMILEKLKLRMKDGFEGYDNYSEEKLRKSLEKIPFSYHDGTVVATDSRRYYDGESAAMDSHENVKRTKNEYLLSQKDYLKALSLLGELGEEPSRVAILATSEHPIARVLAQTYHGGRCEKENQDK